MAQFPTGTLKRGAQAAWPICLGYFPIGLAFGVLAQKAGLTPLQVGLMSVLVFAGSAQFIAAAMIGSGAATGAIIATTFMVNLRHLLMSSALAPFLRGQKHGFLAVFAYGVTDESFALNLDRFRSGRWSPPEALALNQTANAAWLVSTVLGAVVGQAIPPDAVGIDYALTAMFLCLLTLQVRSRSAWAVALSAGAVSLLLRPLLPGNLHVVVATLLGATLGLCLGPRPEYGDEAP